MAKTRRKRKLEEPGPVPETEELLEYYRAMLLIRRFEEKAGQLYGMGLIGGFCHLYIGQESHRHRDSRCQRKHLRRFPWPHGRIQQLPIAES